MAIGRGRSGLDLGLIHDLLTKLVSWCVVPMVTFILDVDIDVSLL